MESLKDDERYHRRVSVNATPAEAMDFANKLAKDDEFRARFEKDPKQVLAESHIYVPYEIKKPVELPSKEEMQKALSEITLGGPFEGPIAGWWFIAFLVFIVFRSVK